MRIGAQGAVLAENETSTFGGRLVEARLAFSAAAKRLVPQTELAGIVGVTPGAWSAWELGRNEPDLATVGLLADALGVNPEWLAWGRGSRYAAQDAPEATEMRPAKQAEAPPAHRPTATDKRAKLRRRKSG